jgi:hypothetical protein
MKRPVPITVCTACGNAGYNLTLTNRRCGKYVNGGRCEGTNSSASGENDWEECIFCRAIGVERNASCMRCSGVGWRLVVNPA